ncbi:MAG: SPOR domain-containing protein [Gallionella sp.]|nr:SPOR domain-containing protein [Gallionella sp.]
MAKQQTEDELNLRRKARRRLIGAIAFTLAVVVILPMVLDSEPKPTGKDIDLRIPAPDKVGEFVPGVAASEVVETLPLAASTVVAASASPAVAQADNETVTSAQPTATSNPRTEVQGKIQPAANKQPEAKAPEPKKSEPKKPESKAPDKANNVESYVVQVGAYANAATAKQEMDKLKKWGFKAYTEKAGDKIRVRVGPYAEREKAEKARQLLEKHGLHPVVTNDK